MITMSHYYFDEYAEKLQLKRTYQPHIVPVLKKKLKAEAAKKGSEQQKPIIHYVVRSYIFFAYFTFSLIEFLRNDYFAERKMRKDHTCNAKASKLTRNSRDRIANQASSVISEQ